MLTQDAQLEDIDENFPEQEINPAEGIYITSDEGSPAKKISRKHESSPTSGFDQ